MTPDPTGLSSTEAQTRRKLHFALGKRAKPTVALVECASLAKRDEVASELSQSLHEYQHYTIDLTPYPVVSLLRVLNEHLPTSISQSLPVEWVVHVYGLENSQLVIRNGRLVPSPMLAQLNLERELLFRQVPYIIVLWGDAGFFRTLQRDAPDFWHWVTYKFRFEDHTARLVATLPPLPPEPISTSGNVAERQARIAELKERYEHLALDDSDQARLLIDKINILSLLGDEYAEAFQYADAEQAYLAVSGMQERLEPTNSWRVGLCIRLGDVYLAWGRLDEALTVYTRAMLLADEQKKGSLLRRFGKVYSDKGDWNAALEYFQQSLQEHINTDNTTQLGDAYHSLGQLYQKQEQWTSALENYQNALDWYQRDGDERGIAGTYHQIGMVYQHQNRWTSALDSYYQALEGWRSIENDFHEAATCYQIAQTYSNHLLLEVKRSQPKLVVNKSLWHELSIESISWYKKALDIASKYGHPNRAMVEEGLSGILQVQELLKELPAISARRVLRVRLGKQHRRKRRKR